MRSTKLLLAVSSEIFCKGLEKLFESEPDIEIVSTISKASQAIEATKAHKPNVILIDIDSPEFSNIKVISHIRQIMPEVCIIILTNSMSSTGLFSAIRVGATGYIFRDGSFESLVKTVALVAEGRLVVAPPMATIAVDALSSLNDRRHMAEPNQISLLSQQERAILTFLAKEATNKEIASTLFLSENTVKAHIRNIMRKLHARSRLEAATCAIEHGLLHSPVERN